MGRNGELAPGLPCREVRDMAESECCHNQYGVPTARRFFVGLCFFYLYVVPPGQVWKLKTRYLSESVFQIDTLKVTDKIKPNKNARPVRDEIWVETENWPRVTVL